MGSKPLVTIFNIDEREARRSNASAKRGALFQYEMESDKHGLISTGKVTLVERDVVC